MSEPTQPLGEIPALSAQTICALRDARITRLRAAADAAWDRALVSLSADHRSDPH